MEHNTKEEQTETIVARNEQVDQKDLLDLILDMETGDPDDFFTLCFLLSHPRVQLRAVTLYPGTSALLAAYIDTDLKDRVHKLD